MDKLRIGIVGCGGISAAHVDAYRGLGDEVDLVAFCDTDIRRAEARASGTGGAVFQDWDALLAQSGVQAVSVCTPPSVHRGMVVAALQQGVAVLCEKPLATTVEDAEAMVEAAERTGTLLMPAFCHRFHPPVAALKEILDAGMLGTPYLFRNMFGGAMSVEGLFRGVKAVAGGGTLMDNSSHAIDMFRYLVGDIVNVSARAETVLQKIETEDLGAVLFEGPRRSMGTVISTYSLPHFDNVVELYGSEGAAVIQYWGSDLRYITAADPRWITVSGAGKPDRFAAEVAHYVRCVRGEAEPLLTPRDGLRAQEIMAAVYRAAEDGVWVSCGP